MVLATPLGVLPSSAQPQQGPNNQQRAEGGSSRRQCPPPAPPSSEPSSPATVCVHPPTCQPPGNPADPSSPHPCTPRTLYHAPSGICSRSDIFAPECRGDSYKVLGRLRAAQPSSLDPRRPTHLDEGAEGGVAGVVRDEEAHVLVGHLHGGWPVHARHGSPQDGAGSTPGGDPSPPNPMRMRMCLSERGNAF